MHNFKNLLAKLEYVGENLYLYKSEDDISNYNSIILMNFLQELINCKDTGILKSLDDIILNKCKEEYNHEYRKYKHHPNSEKLRNDLKSIEQRFQEFMAFINDYNSVKN
jgi:hypothetical protein